MLKTNCKMHKHNIQCTKTNVKCMNMIYNVRKPIVKNSWTQNTTCEAKCKMHKHNVQSTKTNCKMNEQNLKYTNTHCKMHKHNIRCTKTNYKMHKHNENQLQNAWAQYTTCENNCKIYINITFYIRKPIVKCINIIHLSLLNA